MQRGPTGPSVKVLDFGLSVLRRQTRHGYMAVAGTPGYIAPEVLFGAGPSEASDLFAFGVIAFQVLSGISILRSSPVDRVPNVCADAIDWRSVPLDSALVSVLQRLLARDAADRFARAEDVAEALRAAMKLDRLPADEASESFLQAATLVGRGAELQQLKNALKAARVGHGAVILLGGESGVGKSRLCQELKAQAQVRGIAVLRGQADRHSGGLDLFAPALRTLCLEEPLSDAEAGVLKSLLPDLPQLLGRSLADAPELPTQAARLRLLSTIERVLLGAWRPLLVLLEDLHWAQPDSLELLRRLSGQVQSHPVLIVATYRDDERAQLASEVPGAHVLKLARLSAAAVGELIESMVGPIESKAALQDLLLRESEGNTFFIVEVMRALAEQVGGLSQIAQRDLPTSIFAGGVQEALQHRLSRVPAGFEALLKLSAVAGRNVDSAVLRAANPSADIDGFLQRCADVGVLEVSEQQYRFSHDKLREHVLAQLSIGEQRALHAQAARGIEHAYPQSSAHAALLTHHHRQAGDLRRAGECAALAGEQAMLRGALAEAQALLQLAVELLPQRSTTSLQRVRLHRRLLHTHVGRGQLMQHDADLMAALRVAGHPMPSDSAGLWSALSASGLRQGLFRLRPLLQRAVARRATQTPLTSPAPASQAPTSPRTSVSSDNMALQVELCFIYQVAFEYCVWKGDPLHALYYANTMTNAAEMQPDSVMRGLSYSSLACIYSVLPMRSLAEFYAQLAESGYRKKKMSRRTCYAQRGVALMRSFSGQLTAAIDTAEAGLRSARAGQDPYAQLQLLYIRWRAERMHGLLRSAEATALQLCELARSVENQQYLTLGTMAVGSGQLMRGALREASQSLDQALQRAERSGHHELTSHVLGLRALCSLRMGQGSRAQDAVESLFPMLDVPRFAHDSSYESYPACVEVYITLYESENKDDKKYWLRNRIEKSMALLKRFSAVFPSGRAAYHRFLGRWLWLQGQEAAALRAFECSEAAAEEIGLRYDAALAQAWRAGLLPPAMQATALSHALGRLRALGADWDAQTIEAGT